MKARPYPAKDRVAIASAATTGFTASNTDRTQLSYAVEASIAALRAAELGPADVNGIIGSQPTAERLQRALGIPEVTFFANPVVPFVNQLTVAVGAIFSGLCDVVLAYHAAYRLPWNTRSAGQDPFRRGPLRGSPPSPDSIAGPAGYAAWASRYVHEFGLSREDLALVALNGRGNASRNPVAAVRAPLTLDNYMTARMVRFPLCVYDMDLAVDGADAFVITTTERARDLPLSPVLIHTSTLGMIDLNEEAQSPSLRRHGQHVVIDTLRARSDFWMDDCDVYFPYDGFSVIALNWIENVGLCGPGEGPAYLRHHWDEESGRVLVDRRMPMNPHGGGLSEGATQGSGHIREAVHQLQGLAGDRQVPGASRAIVTAGGFFVNAQGCVLRRE
jgi:acetyl-CoA acetyltransferase